MAHGGSSGGQRSVRRRPVAPDSLARAGRRLGTALLGAALPALVAVFGAAAVTGGAASHPVEWLDAAVSTSVVSGRGLRWAFHVALVVGLAGLVALGAALVVEGYFDLD